MSERQPGTSKLVASAAFVGAALFTGWIGSIATTAGLESWFPALNKPFFTPPNAVFPIVWTLLYLMMGFAAWLVWITPGSVARNTALVAFFVQLALNAAWSWAFFGLQNTLLGLIAIIALWIAVGWATLSARRVSKVAALLLAPYLAWVTFATALNTAIHFLN